MEGLNRQKPTELEQLADLWYQGYNDRRSSKYHPSRYHGLNLHAVFHGTTIEYRFFNSTIHAGKVKAYIQFCLAISYQALSQKSASAKKTQTSNPKYTFRTWLLRLGLIGKEFETNLHKEQMMNRCPDSRSVTRVKLKGYQLCFNRVADIVEEEQAVTWGAIYTVSPEDIKNLDRYEGYPNLYDKIPVAVEDDKGNNYQAFA